MSSYIASLSYVFNPTAGTIDFSRQDGFSVVSLKAITDQTQNAFIYLPGIAGYGGTWNSAGTLLTLDADVSTYASTDTLLFQYDDQENALTKLVSLAAGTNITLDGWLRTGAPGSIVQSPSIEKILRSLIAEVRLLSEVQLLLFNQRLDLNEMKQVILKDIS
jgi:hypothetical protein